MTNDSGTRTLRVSLNDVRPEIWRVIEVAADITLGDLHGALIGAMGWDDSHLHSFMVNNEWYSPMYEAIETVGDDEEDVTVSEALPDVGSSIGWMYDWGDSWDHTITVQATGSTQPGITYPILHDGARACPPDDCGGSWGYMDILAMLNDSTYEPEVVDRDEVMEWIGPDFDPNLFHPKRAELQMRNPRPKESW